MSMLSKILAMPRADLKSRLQAVDAGAVKGRGLRRKFEKIRNKQGGFTLLELLVVVLILAAISGTATIMLQDTDRRAAAGAHVAMMDELAKGILTYRVLNQNKLPDIWDSLLYNSTSNGLSGASALPILSKDLEGNIELVGTSASGSVDGILSSADVLHLADVGITRVRVVEPGAEPPSDNGFACNGYDADFEKSLKALINSKDNDVTAQNIFRPAEANGCGYDSHATLAEDDAVHVWVGNQQRVGVAIGSPLQKLIVFGVGPDSTLFDPSIIGSMTGTPVYRHVEKDEYNRFFVLFNIGNYGDNGDTYTSTPVFFQAIIDGAGDTKDEELGEIDNVRPT